MNLEHWDSLTKYDCILQMYCSRGLILLETGTGSFSGVEMI